MNYISGSRKMNTNQFTVECDVLWWANLYYYNDFSIYLDLPVEMSLVRLRNIAGTWVVDLVVWQTNFKSSGKL